MFLFSKKSVGIDISDHSIEIAELKKENGKISIYSSGRIELGRGIVERGKIKDEKKLIAALKDLMAGAKPYPITASKVIFGLPEPRLYTHVFELIPVKGVKMEEAILEEIKNGIPMKYEDTVFSYKILQDAGKNGSVGSRIMILAASRKIIDLWQEFFKKLGMEIEVFDLEAQAVFRGLAKPDPAVPTCLVDIGSQATNISIFNKIGLHYSYSLNCAGEELTRKVADSRKTADGKKIDLNEAEKAKKDIGISGAKEGRDIGQALKNALKPVADEVKVALEYFFDQTGEAVENIVLVGGSSNLRGILEYFTEIFASFIPENYQKKEEIAPDKEKDAAERGKIKILIGKPVLETGSELFFIEAIGLAMRGADYKSAKNDPGITMNSSRLFKKIKKSHAEPKKEGSAEKDSKTGEENKFKSWVKANQKETQLIAILLVGAMLIGGAFLYRNSSKQKKPQNFSISNETQFANAYSFEMDIPIIIQPSLPKKGEARGRIIANKVEKAESFNKALETGLVEAKKTIKQGEKLWESPVSGNISDKTVVFPLNFTWLAYSDSDVTDLFLNETKKRLGENEKYILKSITAIKIDYIEASTTASTSRNYLFHGSVSVLTNKKIEEKPMEVGGITGQATTSTTTVEDILKALKAAKEAGDGSWVTIKSTPTGWLNVRSGPGKENSLVGKAKPGEKYFVLEEKSGWVNIKIDDESGWVSSDYVEKAK